MTTRSDLPWPFDSGPPVEQGDVRPPRPPTPSWQQEAPPPKPASELNELIAQFCRYRSEFYAFTAWADAQVAWNKQERNRMKWTLYAQFVLWACATAWLWLHR